MDAPIQAISRHRIGSDGAGVTTLVCFNECPLRCAYCINPETRCADPSVRRVTPEALLSELRVDHLYFLATGGGVCFGGGEPLLRADYIAHFAAICPPEWNLYLESSLWVPRRQLETVIPHIAHYFIDCKDLHEEIYRAYTGQRGTLARENLAFLLQTVDPDRVTVRLPRIPGYNSDSDRDESEAILREWGVHLIDRFDYRIIPK